MSEIGGYFELELHKVEEYHKTAIRLNTGRNAFEYILRVKGYRKVYLPYFTCEAMIEPINKLKLEYGFYNINMQLEPLFDFDGLGDNETFIYTNYFGIKGEYVKKLSRICTNLIIDNSQAFFEKPVKGIDTFYSPRKFFGIPDGAYLYTTRKLKMELEKDNSLNRFGHLPGRIENGAEVSYDAFIRSEKTLDGQPIKLMSDLTQRLLRSIDYETVAEIRNRNFNYLHNLLGEINILRLNKEEYCTPLIYPFLSDNKDLRSYLIQNKIFVAQYWPNVLKWCKEGSIEKRLTLGMLSLPADQRYSEKQMQKIIDLILRYA